MVAWDLPSEAPSASEITEVLLELAGLSQQAGSATADVLGSIAGSMLERLLVLGAALRGAIFLSMQAYSDAEQPALLPPSTSSTMRTLALHGLHEQEAYALLATFPSRDGGDSHNQPLADISCWIMYRLPVGELQAVVVLGWSGLEGSACTVAAERSRKLLAQVASAAGAVMASILMAERIHELEFAATREAMHQMELLKAELIATVSHELRSPLASIKGYAATLLRHERRLSREERHQFLLAINEASDRLEVIIERLLEMSQLDTGAITLQRSPVDAARLAQEAINAAEQNLAVHAAGRFLFRLQVQASDGTPETGVPLIQADPRRLREVLDNLLENAIKYSPEGGTVTVIVRPAMQSLEGRGQTIAPTGSQESDPFVPGGGDGLSSPSPPSSPPHTRMLEICVKDSGMGIPVEHIERIFERFHRVDMRLTREVNGLGLGLAICKHIVELHRGIIWAESSPSGGSIFHALLPVQ